MGGFSTSRIGQAAFPIGCYGVAWQTGAAGKSLFVFANLAATSVHVKANVCPCRSNDARKIKRGPLLLIFTAKKYLKDFLDSFIHLLAFKSILSSVCHGTWSGEGVNHHNGSWLQQSVDILEILPGPLVHTPQLLVLLVGYPQSVLKYRKVKRSTWKNNIQYKNTRFQLISTYLLAT